MVQSPLNQSGTWYTVNHAYVPYRRVAGDDITQGLPRIQEIFEARNPKGQAVITEVTGEVIDISEDPATRQKK